MSKAIWKFTKREVVRIIKAALAAGILAPRLEFRPDGTIVLMAGDQDQQQPVTNEWDE